MRNKECITKAPCRNNCPILDKFSSIERRVGIVPITQSISEIDRVKSIDARKLHCPPGAVANAEIRIFERAL